MSITLGGGSSVAKRKCSGAYAGVFDSACCRFLFGVLLLVCGSYFLGYRCSVFVGRIWS